MSHHYCVACRVAPASIFCSADAAFLCSACDILVHEANKLSRCHTRVPLHLIDTLNIQLTDPSSKAELEIVQSPHKSSSADTGFDESDDSSGFLVPDTDNFRDMQVSSPFTTHHPYYNSPLKEEPSWTQHMWNPVVPDTDQERLDSIAGAFVKKEAQTLFESSRCQSVDSDIVKDLDISWMKDPLPAVDNSVYSVPDDSRHFVEEQQLLHGSRFNVPDEHDQRAINEVLGSSLTTEEDSSIPDADLSSRVKSERTSPDELERTDEQKRQDRQAALRRFRHKRANRSFRKKVRYACRKQLADSRPRVKGRFVGRAKTAPAGRIQKSGITETAG